MTRLIPIIDIRNRSGQKNACNVYSNFHESVSCPRSKLRYNISKKFSIIQRRKNRELTHRYRPV